MIDAKDIEPLPNGGNRFGWVYKMAGVRFEGSSEVIAYVANQRTVTVSEGGISSTITWLFEAEDGGTRVTFESRVYCAHPVDRQAGRGDYR